MFNHEQFYLMVAKKDGLEDGWESMPAVEINDVTS